MHTRLISCWTLLALLLTCRSSFASAAISLSLEELLGLSDRVAEVELVEASSAWSDGGKRIYTTFDFAVHEDLAGGGARRVRIVQPGGQVGSLAQHTFGYPRFQFGERYVVFLVSDKEHYFVIGLGQGAFRVSFATSQASEVLAQQAGELTLIGGPKVPVPLTKAALRRLIRVRWLAGARP